MTRWWNKAPKRVDVLAIGAHPDDVELHAAGTLCMAVKKKKKVVIVDATEGECSSNGNLQTRRKETLKASKLMGIHARANLLLPDAGLQSCDELLPKLVELIRKLQPNLVLTSVPDTRHPDHSALSKAVKDASFLSGVGNYLPEYPGTHRPKKLWYYYEVHNPRPDCLVDISEVIGLKQKAINAYSTQFVSKPKGKTTLINSGFADRVIERCRYWGQISGVNYAEPFSSEYPPLVENFYA